MFVIIIFAKKRSNKIRIKQKKKNFFTKIENVYDFTS